ncbi:MAG: hypothetical protein M3151_13435 [Actinomycetota bacterium]|nr:hypothetical protein [Actinomycetota bacterium]
MIRPPTEVPVGGRVLAWSLLLATLVAALLLLAVRPAHAATTFTVDSTGNEFDANLGNGKCDVDRSIFVKRCTLRAAIEEANATPNSGGPDLIRFAIPGDGPHTIAPTTHSRLPTIKQPVIIDGYTQGSNTATTTDDAKPNAAPTSTNAVLKIVLTGANLPPGSTAGVNGLEVTSGAGTTIRGLVINGFREATDGSGHGGHGILAFGPNNVISGNFIGTNALGTTRVPNQGMGVLASGASTIGGTARADRNLISGNGDGVEISGNGGKVHNNLIGTDKTGTGNLGNAGNGVVSPGPNIAIGGSGVANIIAFNGRDGVLVDDPARDASRILDNSIFSNGEEGIDLGGDGPTSNDLKDLDAGPNDLQNKPNITSAATTGGVTTIRGNLNSTPSKTFTIQFFSNPGTDEGKTFKGQKSVTTDSDGNALFVFTPATPAPTAHTITATATDSNGSTSEFSAPRTVVAQ